MSAIKVTIDCGAVVEFAGDGYDCPGQLHYEVDLGRPAPYAESHDDPAFSALGDPGYVDTHETNCPRCGRLLTAADVDRAVVEAQRVVEADVQDAAERAYELKRDREFDRDRER